MQQRIHRVENGTLCIDQHGRAFTTKSLKGGLAELSADLRSVESTDFGSFVLADIPRFQGISMRSDLSTSPGLEMSSEFRASPSRRHLCRKPAGFPHPWLLVFPSLAAWAL